MADDLFTYEDITRIAAGPPNFSDVGPQEPGLPRPQWHTDPRNYLYNLYKGNSRRKLFRKIPVPWNSYGVNNDIPDFGYDATNLRVNDIAEADGLGDLDSYIVSRLEDDSRSLQEKCCPMCGGQFDDDETTVIYTGSQSPAFISDYLPYHQKCMDLVNKHCPHLRRDNAYRPENYDFGTYDRMVQKGVNNYVNGIVRRYNESGYRSIGSKITEAAQPPEFIPGPDQPVGLPRPQHKTDRRRYIYPKYEPHAGERRLFKKIPVPWNSTQVDEDVPEFDKDKNNEIEKIISGETGWKGGMPDRSIQRIFEQDSESYAKKCCPMCGGKFEDDDPAAIYQGSTILSSLSDFLPYHPHCMKLVQAHCPHIRYEIKDLDSPQQNPIKTGKYGDLLKEGVENYGKHLNQAMGYYEDEKQNRADYEIEGEPNIVEIMRRLREENE